MTSDSGPRIVFSSSRCLFFGTRTEHVRCIVVAASQFANRFMFCSSEVHESSTVAAPHSIGSRYILASYQLSSYSWSVRSRTFHIGIIPYKQTLSLPVLNRLFADSHFLTRALDFSGAPGRVTHIEKNRFSSILGYRNLPLSNQSSSEKFPLEKEPPTRVDSNANSSSSGSDLTKLRIYFDTPRFMKHSLSVIKAIETFKPA